MQDKSHLTLLNCRPSAKIVSIMHWLRLIENFQYSIYSCSDARPIRVFSVLTIFSIFKYVVFDYTICMIFLSSASWSVLFSISHGQAFSLVKLLSLQE